MGTDSGIHDMQQCLVQLILPSARLLEAVAYFFCQEQQSWMMGAARMGAFSFQH